MEIPAYEHKAQYYETDQMGIVHHSNYIRWFEEARVDYMDGIGLGYDVMEANGIVSPVLAITCEYKSMTRFKDTVVITPKIVEYTGAKLSLSYTVADKATGEVRCTGTSRHCFLTRENKVLSLKRARPEFHSIICAALNAQDNL